jgi:regulatory protein
MFDIDLIISEDKLTITDMTLQKRRKERVNIYLDGEYAFSLARINAAGLAIGQILTGKDVEALKAEDAYEAAKQNTFRLISYRPRSIAEVKKRLGSKGYDEATVERTVKRMVELEMLDDLAFARYWVDQRETFKPRGRRALRYELYQKGIDREIVENVLAGLDETASARRAGSKKAVLWAEFPREEFFHKMDTFLRRRGFDYETSRSVAQELWDFALENKRRD